MNEFSIMAVLFIVDGWWFAKACRRRIGYTLMMAGCLCGIVSNAWCKEPADWAMAMLFLCSLLQVAHEWLNWGDNDQ